MTGTGSGRGNGGARAAALPDLVYPVKNAGEELRYSLRSVARNARGLYGRVWIVGDRPDWAVNVGHIEAAGRPGSGRGGDVRAKIAAACAHPDVADTFLLMHDDYFLVDPVTEWRAYHMGPIRHHITRLRRSPDTSRAWLRYVVETADWLESQGYRNGLTWQGHRPLVWDKRKLGKALKRAPRTLQLDIVGLFEMAGAPMGTPARGCNSKVRADDASFHRKMAERDIPWLSTSDRAFAFGLAGRFIRGLFPDPCEYERGRS